MQRNLSQGILDHYTIKTVVSLSSRSFRREDHGKI